MTIFDKTQKISSKWAFKTDNLSEYHSGKQKTAAGKKLKVKIQNLPPVPFSKFQKYPNIMWSNTTLYAFPVPNICSFSYQSILIM